MAHPKTQTGGSGANARQVDAPTVDELDEIIERLRAQHSDRSKYISLIELAKKCRIHRANMRNYAKIKGYNVVHFPSLGQHRPTSYLTLEDATRLVEQRAKEGLL